MRPYSLIIVAAAALALVACSQGAEPAAPPASTDPAPLLAGVDLTRPLRALGNEPFWAVEFTGGEMIYSGVDRPEQRAPQPAPVLQGTVATWSTTTSAGAPLKVTLSATECSDGMSDRTYPLTSIVEIAGETLTGCAASSAALANAGESGLVVETAQPAA